MHFRHSSSWGLRQPKHRSGKSKENMAFILWTCPHINIRDISVGIIFVSTVGLTCYSIYRTIENASLLSLHNIAVLVRYKYMYNKANG